MSEDPTRKRKGRRTVGAKPGNNAIRAARDLALQKIGRNVVNFQKMEAMLRFVLTIADFSAPASKSRERLASGAQAHRKKAFGHLVDGATKALHSEPASVPVDIHEIWIKHSLSLCEGGSHAADWRREMHRVVRERNALIHRTLATWNPNSVDSCRSLCEQLDAQRERILPAYKHLESV